MRKIRAYQQQPLQPGSEVVLDERVSHHWRHVLRLQSGAQVWLFNGDGMDYAGQLLMRDKRHCEVLLQAAQAVLGNQQPRLQLYQGLARAERMDFVLQKATELGVDEIQPLQTQFSQLQLHGGRLRKRMQHWQQVIISACEQSGRATLPLLHEPVPVSAVAATDDTEVLDLLLQPRAACSLSRRLQQAADKLEIRLTVGPEGGFSEAENQQFVELGFAPVTVGSNVLRTETAAIAAVALVKLAGFSRCAADGD